MSKNVAVFVDVANIFYAAKAAGVDIDYVTLLKAAIAGRDFVRAYAYTGLDPENENQRQFHSFLSRNGYRVVSKDIRKYGDGKIKANLDIELVVDLMRTSRNLDVAVVVSGDGDFAPAIRAVQQMGVRVEVISFRGNTSSDLFEVADVFTDITQIARVEKASTRSGRRVAAEGDLSMTEVPHKETEGGPRRRRRTRGVDEIRPAARTSATLTEPASLPGNLIVLPGEKLSRLSTAGSEAEAVELDEVAEEGTDVEEAAGSAPAGVPASDEEAATADEAGHRRRRRRGGRGRGRGRGVEREVTPAALGAEEEEEAAEYEVPRLPQHSTFGSVWDSQLGVPSAPPRATVGLGGVEPDEDEDEPEIPEYLLAERRQRAARGVRTGGTNRMPGGRGRGGRNAAYQSAIDRERFGRGGAPSSTPGFPPRRDDRGRQGRRSPERPRDVPFASPAQRGNGDPWTEVPPEVEELLRAELARRGGRGPEGPPRPTVRERSHVAASGIGEVEPDETGRTTTGGPAETATSTEGVAAPEGARTARRRTRRAAPQAAPGAATLEAAEAAAAAATSQSIAEPGDVTTPDGPAPARRRAPARRTAAGAGAASPPPSAEGPETPAAESAAPKRTPRRRATAARDGAGTGPADAAAPATPAPSEVSEAAPRRRTTRRRAAETEAES